MSRQRLNMIKETLCVTCLSQNRSLFAVNARDFLTFNIDLKLSKKDKICWECRAILQKMMLFKQRVLHAQAVLATILHENNSNTISLSSLVTNTTFHVNISDEKTDTYENGDVKLEPDEEVKFEKQELASNDEDMKDEFEILVEYPVIEGDDDGTVKGEDEDACEEMNDDGNAKNVGKSKRKKRVNKKVNEDYELKHLTESELCEWREMKRSEQAYVEGQFKCTRCIRVYENAKLLEIHEKKHNEIDRGYSCKICGFRFLLQSTADAHLKNHYRLYKCRQCAFACDTLQNMSKHNAIEHNIMLNCEHCSSVFGSQSMLKRHKMSHKEKQDCPHCMKKISACNMKRHFDVHKSEMLKCEVCGKQYRGKWNLKAHMRTHADKPDEAAFCAECGLQFANVYVFREHVRTTRNHLAAGDRPHKCDQCGKRFSKKEYLSSHTLAMHSDAKNYACDVCSSEFKTYKSMRAHVRAKHEGRVKPKKFICEICDKGFTSKYVLSNHLNTHSGARPHACALCPARFAHSATLYIHNKLKHQRQKKIYVKKNK